MKSITTANGENPSSSASAVILGSPKSGKQRHSGDSKLARYSARANPVRCVKDAKISLRSDAHRDGAGPDAAAVAGEGERMTGMACEKRMKELQAPLQGLKRWGALERQLLLIKIHLTVSA